MSINPFGDFRTACEEALEGTFSELYPSVCFSYLRLDVPPNPEFGQLSAALFELSKRLKKKPRELAQEIVKAIQIENVALVDRVEAAGGGYVNFYVDFSAFSELTINSALTLDASYGYVKTDTPKKIIVEHTSANPVSPIHIGTARNPILGDALARILTARGHRVRRHFYVDDVGRQTSVVSYGYEKLGEPTPKGKPDHYIGVIYTLTSAMVEIERVKNALSDEKILPEEAKQLHEQFKEWSTIAEEVKKKDPQLYTKFLDGIRKDVEIEPIINSLNQAYEAGQGKSKRLVREVCQLSLSGIKETLNEAEIFFDSWDWESDLIWKGDVANILKALKDTDYVFQEGPVLEFNANKVAEDFNLKPTLGIKDDHEIPPLTLVRADGTTLYTTRDIPYTIWKFRKAQKVINVVGMEQTLSQQQLRLALWALGYDFEAENLTHFAYSLVNLPGFKMSGRRGRYITLDEVMEEAVRRAYSEVEKRSPQLKMEEKQKISKIVGTGALKYAFLEVDPMKPVFFTWDRVINFEKNSAPYIQYSYARARSILRKAQRKPVSPDYSLLGNQLEQKLVLMIARFPEIFVDAAEMLKPNNIAGYANTIADMFNSFYNTLPVLNATPMELSDSRLAMVQALSVVLRNSLYLMGIVAPERM